MKRLMLLLGPVVALVGAAGLVKFGDAAVRVFYDTLTFRVVDPPGPPPASLSDLRLAVMSGTALAAGLVVSCVAVVMRPPVVSTISRWLLVAAGVSLVGGGAFMGSAVIRTQMSLRIIASSESVPTPGSVQEALRVVEPRMTTGHGILVLSAVLLLAAGLTGIGHRARERDGPPAPLGAFVAVAAAAVGLGVCLLWAGVWLNGDAVEGMISAATPQHPAELAAQLSGILSKTLLMSVGVAALGLVLVLAAATLPAPQGDASAEAHY